MLSTLSYRKKGKKHNKRLTFKQICDLLHAKHQALLLEHQAVAVRHAALLSQQAMLKGWFEVLELLQATADDAADPACRLCDADLTQLLQEVAALEDAAADTTTGGGQAGGGAYPPCLDPLQQTIGQPDDPVAYLRDLASRPLVEGVEQLTAMQHLVQHRELAQALAVQLHLLEHPTSPQLSAMGEIKQLLDRHFHLLWSLIRAGKLDVVESTKVFKLDTQELLSRPDLQASPLVDNQDSISSMVLPALQLSVEQEDAVAHIMELCEHLMAPIVAEIAQLQQQLGACISSRSGGSGGSDGSGGRERTGAADTHTSKRSSASHTNKVDSGSTPSNTQAEAGVGQGDNTTTTASQQQQQQPTPSAKELLEREQQVAARLQVVLSKQYHVVAASTAIFVSQLTWRQAAKMICYRWPYTASMQFLAKAIWQQQRQRLQRERLALQQGVFSMDGTPAATEAAGAGRAVGGAPGQLGQQDQQHEGSMGGGPARVVSSARSSRQDPTS